MTKRETLVKIAKENLGKTLTVDWFNENYPEFFYTPDNSSSKYLDENIIAGLLWGYNVTFTRVFAPEGTYRKIAKTVKISEIKKKTNWQKFLELAKPNDDGCTSKVDLTFGNGGSWCREGSRLTEIFKVKFNRKGNSDSGKIISIELLGWNRDIQFDQRIKREIVEELRNKPCVFTGSTNNIEIDHKDGRKNDLSLNDVKNQTKDSFQPVCKAMNDVKRQKCKECKRTNKRWNATNIEGNPVPFYKGGEEYTGTCEGCYLYDPVAYRIYVFGNK